ncbi:MAG: hypothetical protein R3Y26_04430 [Rikenellaceae bacterium]
MEEIVCNWTFPGDVTNQNADSWSFLWDPTVILIIYVLAGYLICQAISKLGGFKSFKPLSKRERAGRILGVIVGVGLLGSCVGKTMCYLNPGSLPMLTKLTSFGIAWMIPAIYVVEIISAVCLFSKKFYKLGIWAAICTTTGAAIAHMPLMADGPYWAVTSGSLLIITFLSALLYAPEMFPTEITKLFGIKYTKTKE